MVVQIQLAIYQIFNNLLYADIIFLAAARIFGKRTTPNELQKGLFA